MFFVESIYFGGGTPSLLTPKQISTLVKHIKQSFNISKEAQWSLEANPSYLTQAKLDTWLKLGIDRLSLGVQSLSETLLAFLGRDHNKELVLNALENCYSSGFCNISVDVMMGLPEQRLKDLEDILNLSKHQAVKHISCYSLSIEANTPFKKQNISPLNETEQVKQERFIQAYLYQAGFKQYEISNYAKKGFESKHNVFYWLRKPYIGLGPGAHSWFKYRRYKRAKDIHAYCKAPKPNLPKNTLSKKEAFKDFLLARTRYLKAINLNDLANQFGPHYIKNWPEILSKMHQAGYIEEPKTTFQLKQKGQFVLDSLVQELWEKTCLSF